MVWIFFVLILGGPLWLWLRLWSPGPLAWPIWAYLSLVLPLWVANGYRLYRHNPELFKRRAEVGQGTPLWDRRLVTAMKFSVLLSWALAARQAQSPAIWVWALGAGLFLASLWQLQQAQLSNPFCEGMVRKQDEFEHTVVRSGPYAVCRHPGYRGFLGVIGSIPLLLGSTWSVLGVMIFTVLLLLRIAREEAFLRENLEGYPEYCQEVRWRLFPGY